MSDFDESLFCDFLNDINEGLSELDSSFLELEKDSSQAGVIDRILRVVHSIKGASGFLKFAKLESLAHKAENLLVKVRKNELVLGAHEMSLLFKTIDLFRSIVSNLSEHKSEGNVNVETLVAQIEQAIQKDKQDKQDKQVKQDKEDKSKIQPEAPVASLSSALGSESKTSETKTTVNTPSASSTPNNNLATNTIRIRIDLLDKLMNLTSELIGVRNRVLEYHKNEKNPSMHTVLTEFRTLSSELQDNVMHLRLQPVGSLFNQFPRIVRDLALGVEKKIDVSIEGEETELDKTILEAIKDPFTHIIRNSVDHGIESPAKRLAAGKKERGHLRFSAKQESGFVVLRVEDDGGGIDPDRVKGKAIEKNLITIEQAILLTDQESINLVFAPGFSTAEQVSNLSGRGVGMDVVRSNIEKIGGNIVLSSVKGRGTEIKIQIPLTLAVLPSLIVTVSGKYFLVPQVCLQEVIVLPEKYKKNEDFEKAFGVHVYEYRNQLIPLVCLQKHFGLLSNDNNQKKHLVVVSISGGYVAWLVDRTENFEDIVIRPLDAQLSHIQSFSGVASLANGRLGFILDPMGLLREAELQSRSFDGVDFEKGATKNNGASIEYLIFEGGEKSRWALDLNKVKKVVDIPKADVEFINQKLRTFYFNDFIDLIDLRSEEHEQNSFSKIIFLNPSSDLSDDFANKSENWGIIIDRIIDTGHSEKTSENNRTILTSEGITDIFFVEEHLERKHFERKVA